MVTNSNREKYKTKDRLSWEEEKTRLPVEKANKQQRRKKRFDWL